MEHGLGIESLSESCVFGTHHFGLRLRHLKFFAPYVLKSLPPKLLSPSASLTAVKFRSCGPPRKKKPQAGSLWLRVGYYF